MILTIIRSSPYSCRLELAAKESSITFPDAFSSRTRRWRLRFLDAGRRGAEADPVTPAPRAASPPAPSILLIHGPTRADHSGRAPAALPHAHLDALAPRVRYFRGSLVAADAARPCSLLTGCIRPRRVPYNGITAALPPDVPTLATVLAARGYATGAFVASRVLDRRFGLARGFTTYDDAMTAERMGEQGYPERDAAAVTTAALGWAARVPARGPWFLWVHYYDAHAPYQPPGAGLDVTAAQRYAGEVAYVDREVGRLLAGLRRAPDVVAAVGDHGEMLGEPARTGTASSFIRRASRVPLTGPPVVPPGPRTLRPSPPALPATLSRSPAPRRVGSGRPPGMPTRPRRAHLQRDLAARHRIRMGARAGFRQTVRYVAAPAAELYDTRPTRGARNLVTTGGEARRLEPRSRRWRISAARRRRRRKSTRGGGACAALYHSGASGTRKGTIDPREVALVAGSPPPPIAAKERVIGGVRESVAAFAASRPQPRQVPFWSRQAQAARVGARPGSRPSSTRSVYPPADFLHLLRRAYFERARSEEARAEYG